MIWFDVIIDEIGAPFINYIRRHEFMWISENVTQHFKTIRLNQMRWRNLCIWGVVRQCRRGECYVVLLALPNRIEHGIQFSTSCLATTKIFLCLTCSQLLSPFLLKSSDHLFPAPLIRSTDLRPRDAIARRPIHITACRLSATLCIVTKRRKIDLECL